MGSSGASRDAAGVVGGSAPPSALCVGGPAGRSVLLQLADAVEVVMSPGGAVHVGGGGLDAALGTAPRSERLLRLLPSVEWPGLTGPAAPTGGDHGGGRRVRALLPSTRVLTPDLAVGGVATSVHVTLEVGVRRRTVTRCLASLPAFLALLVSMPQMW